MPVGLEFIIKLRVEAERGLANASGMVQNSCGPAVLEFPQSGVVAKFTKAAGFAGSFAGLINPVPREFLITAGRKLLREA